MISFLFKVLVLLAIVGLGFGIFLTIQAEHSAKQKIFIAGKLPTPSPDGFYHGGSSDYIFSWIGKKFNKTDSTGINVFDAGAGETQESYSFVTSESKGLRDKTISVLQISYNVPSNPFWLKHVVDEVVEISPGSYIGKMELKILPGYPFTLGFFTLNKI